MTTTKITVTSAFAASVAALVAAKKTPWLIVNADYAVGVYAGRNEARAAKVANKFEGTIIKASDVEVKVVDLAKPKADKGKSANASTVKAKAADKRAKADETDPRNLTVCPKCGSTELYAGRNKGGFVVDEDSCGGCHHCDWEYDLGILRTSTIESPCFTVWDTADKMTGARRKDVIAACVAKGIAFYTARTQYQLWLTAKKNDEAVAAKNASKK